MTPLLRLPLPPSLSLSLSYSERTAHSTWAFFGEIAKFSTHSPDRFVAIDCSTTDGYTFEVRGFAGEEVTVIAAQWISSSGGGTVHTVTVKVGASGKGKGGFPA